MIKSKKDDNNKNANNNDIKYSLHYKNAHLL